MKKTFLIAFAILATTSALISCAKTDANSGNAGYYQDPYGNYYGNGGNGQYGSLNFVYGAVASITDMRNYRDFLRGDFCTHFAFFNFTCKLVDNPPVMVLSLQSTEVNKNGMIFGHLTINVMPDLGVSVNGNPVPKKEIPLRFVYGGNVNVLEGQNQDYYTEGSGIPRQIRVRLMGLKKDARQVTVEVMYDGRPMLLGYLNR